MGLENKPNSNQRCVIDREQHGYTFQFTDKKSTKIWLSAITFHKLEIWHQHPKLQQIDIGTVYAHTNPFFI